MDSVQGHQKIVLIAVGQGHEGVRLENALALQHFVVGAIAVDDLGVGQQFG